MRASYFIKFVGPTAAGVWRLLVRQSACGKNWAWANFLVPSCTIVEAALEWAKVIELLAVNRLVAPESELGVHQRWYATTAMDVVLGTDDAVAAKDRLYRALDKALEHKEALERHLAQRWRDLFGAKCDLLLYDLTSTYFEGQAGRDPGPRGAATAVIHGPMLCS